MELTDEPFAPTSEPGDDDPIVVEVGTKQVAVFFLMLIAAGLIIVGGVVYIRHALKQRYVRGFIRDGAMIGESVASIMDAYAEIERSRAQHVEVIEIDGDGPEAVRAALRRADAPRAIA